MPEAIRRARRALREFRIDGVETNIPVLRAIVDNEDFLADRISTAFLETHIGPILAASAAFEPKPATAERNKGRDVRDIDPPAFSGPLRRSIRRAPELRTKGSQRRRPKGSFPCRRRCKER